MTDSQLNCRSRAREFLFTAIYHNRTRMTRLFLKKFDIFFSEQLLWTFEDFKGKKRKKEENGSYHGLAWIGMINQNVSWFFLPKIHKTSKCPFYRPSGGFSKNWFMNIMHIHVRNMQFYTLASVNLFLQFILWAPEMGWNCPTLPHSDKNDKLHENGGLVSENKYILLPMVKKKSIMRKQRGFLLSRCTFPWPLLHG